MKGYTLIQVFLTFIIYAFLGWCLEVTFHLFKSKKFINRGFLNGPICPIYGVGAVMVLLFLGNLGNKFWVIFSGGAIFASLLELVTGYTLEKIFNTRWWDYSNNKFNIGGYISLSFTIIWGFVSVFMMYILQPIVNNIVNSIPRAFINPIAVLIFGVFILDLITTIRALVSFKAVLNEIEGLRGQLNSKLDIISKNIEERIDGTIESWDERLVIIKKEIVKLLPTEDVESIVNRFTNIREKLGKRQKRFMEIYPTLVPEEIKNKLKELMSDKNNKKNKNS